jgi:hypothetical protein
VTRRFRAGAWIVILGLGIFQAYANRYAVSPDGMSYLDLSDAVVTGRLGNIVNLYWSPLYPFLIGAARAVFGAGPEREVQIVHLVNVIGLAVMFAAFEYFIIPVLATARTRRGSALDARWGALGAYTLFACLAFTMTPLELTTPDLFSSAAIFFALGAMLRLRERGEHDTRNSMVLGVALGLGALAKSFLVPWAVVCFACVALLRRKSGVRPLAFALGAWLLFVAPWSALLSARAGRPTFGDTGRLTYVWYVNMVDMPSLGGVPSGARTRATDRLLPGVGVTGDAPGTDPMWYDPARWNASLKPRVSISDETKSFLVLSVTLFGTVSVLSYFAFLLAVAPGGTRRGVWTDGWIVLVPALAGIGAYCLVVMTARYIMAFVVAAILVALATLPIARRVLPVFVLIGLVVAIGAQSLAAATAFGMSFVIAVAAAMYVGTVVNLQRRVAWFVWVTLTIALSVLIFAPSVPMLMRVGAAAFTLLLWSRARGAVRNGTTVAFARGMHAGLLYAVTLIFAGRLGIRVARETTALSNAAAGNPQMMIADDLRAHGIVPGTRIAIIGPHAESYWARTARLKIVANVPNPLTGVWWTLPASRRDQILAEFARNGAEVAIATSLPDNETGAPDSTWTPLRYRGLMRRLTPPATIAPR